MKLKTLVSTILAICVTIGLSFTINPDVAVAAGVIHNGDPCYSNDYEGQWVIGDIPGYGAPETKICVRGTAKKSPGDFLVSKDDYCYEKGTDNKSYLSTVIEKDGIYGCGYPEFEPETTFSSVKDSCSQIGGEVVFEDEFVVGCRVFPTPMIYGLFSPFEEACAGIGAMAHGFSPSETVCFL